MTGTHQVITALSLVSTGAWLHHHGTLQCQLRIRDPHHSWPYTTGRDAISSCQLSASPVTGGLPELFPWCTDTPSSLGKSDMLTCRQGIAWCRAPSAQNRILLHQLDKNYLQPSIVRPCYLWCTAVGGNTNHGGQTPSCTCCICWSFSPPAGHIPLSSLPAVSTCWETTKNLLDPLMLICLLLSQLHEFAAKCMGQMECF